MSYELLSILLPAIPLAIVAFNFRYTSLAGLMRALSKEAEAQPDADKINVLKGELNILIKRMLYVKGALFFAALSFALCLLSLLSVFSEIESYSHILVTGAIIGLILACILFCAETVLSTTALNMHLNMHLPHHMKKQMSGPVSPYEQALPKQ